MGILNATPDSFSDGGQFYQRDAGLKQAEKMIAAGVDIIDIGGESTRPGAEPVALQEELDRVLPVIEALKECGAALSIDTYKPEVMRTAIDAGVDIVNDVCALQEDGALEIVAASEVFLLLCVMLWRDPKILDRAFWSNVGRTVSVSGFTTLTGFIMVQLMPLGATDKGFLTLGIKLATIASVTLIVHVSVSALFGLEQATTVLSRLKSIILRPIRIQ
jgi:hypothetical protein